MPPLLLIHIATASVGLLAGATAMILRKGSPRHRHAGRVFCVAMLSMGASGAVLAVLKHQTLNALVGGLTFYMVATAWLAGRRKMNTVLLDRAALLLAATLTAMFLAYGVAAMRSPGGVTDGEPVAGYLFFGFIALLCTALDLRMWVRSVTGAHRLARHLWRMCFPMGIAVISVIPRLYRLYPGLPDSTPLQLAPVLLILAVMSYWLWRVLFAGRSKRAKHGALVSARITSDRHNTAAEIDYPGRT